MSTYQDGATIGVVLGQKCKRVFGGVMGVMWVKGMHPHEGEEERRSHIYQLGNCCAPPCGMGYVWGRGGAGVDT